jgi:hypothetical protein
MPRCEHTEICPFFTAEVGFSPELHDAMKSRYCLGDNSTCARLLACEQLGGVEFVPTDMLPSDDKRLAGLKK